MSEFKHSIVLFTGDDGLPLEFNVRNTVDKALLKALIEFGGGFCTQNENAVHLISPETKVLNVDTGKKLVSSSYIYDCVKENYLLDVNDYVFTIAEAQTSDISDENSEESLIPRHSTCKSPKKNTNEKMNFQISPIKSPSKISCGTDSTTPSNLTLYSSNNATVPVANSSSTHSESFVEGTQEENSNVKIRSHIYSDKEPVEKYKSPFKLFPPHNNNSSVVSPQKCKSVDNRNILSSPKNNKPFSANHLEKRELYDNLVFSGKKFASDSPIKSSALTKSSSKNFEVSPRKGTLINEEAILSSPIRCLTFSDNAKEPLKQTDQFLYKPSVFIKSPKNFAAVSPRKCSPIKEAILSSPLRRLPFTDHAREATEAMELCHSLPFSPHKSPTLFPNEMPAIIKSDKTVELNQKFVKSPSKRETFALRPVNELFQNSPPPIEFVNQEQEYMVSSDKFNEVYRKGSPSHTVVTSSQPEDGLDKFDNMLLSKIQKKPLSEDENSLSQSFTVSSSADAQVSSKPCSSDINVPELPKENAANEPDSPSLISSQTNVPMYVKNLEEKMEKILKQNPPLSIQDKIAMVKYICCVRKLPPATVLNSIFTNSLDL